MNNIQQFLEERHKRLLAGEVLDARESDRTLVNFVLSEVDREAKQTKTKEFSDQVLTIITNLRIK